MKEKQGEHPFGDAGQLILTALFLVTWIADSFFLKKTTFLAATIPLPLRLLLLVLMMAAAMGLMQSSHFVLEHDTRPDHVVSQGGFHLVRHPLYLASQLFFLALAVSTASLACLVLLVGIFIFYNAIAGYEEALLEAKFGDAYRRYKAETGKWLPRWHSIKSTAFSKELK